MKRTPSQALSQWLPRPVVRTAAAICLLLSLIVAWPWVDAIEYDRRIESLLPQQTEVVQSFLRLRRVLGGADALLVVWHEPDLLNPDGSGLKRLQALVPQIRQLPEVSGTLSLLELEKAIQATRPTPLNLFGTAKPQTPTIVSPTDPLAQDLRDQFASYTHSPQGDWAGIAILLREGSDQAAAIQHVREIMLTECSDRDDLSLVGEPVLIVEGMKLLEEDGIRLSRSVLILLSITLLIMLRRPRWVLAIVILVIWSRWMTRAILAVAGTKLTMVSGMLDAVVTVIAVAASMHLALTYSQLAVKHIPMEAARRMWQRLLSPVFWSLVTTAVGFASLAVSEIVPVRQFGWMMALGTCCIFVGMLIVFPLFAGPPQLQAKQFGGNLIESYVVASSLY